ncbi:MAG: orotate phosphoribosyltransferase [Nitrososphaerota archaeon]|nr:orotate phosphoribosyltransferase [Nitrososphaerota archaeon]
MPDEKSRLKDLIVARAIEFRSTEFILASGQKSNMYVDLRRITQDPEGINLIASLISKEIAKLAPKAISVGGLETGSIPIATAVCLKSFGSQSPLSAFWVRKKQKDHGLQNLIEGNLKPGAKVVIVDDTVTTGGSSLQAVEAVRAFGAEVVLAISVVDRGADYNFKKAGIPYYALFSEGDLNASRGD